MTNNTEKFLTISSWNINGLESKTNGVKSNKIHDPEVINTLNKFDLIGLMETHAGSETEISLQDYYVFRKDRPKHKKAWKSSGGIAVLVRNLSETLAKLILFLTVMLSGFVYRNRLQSFLVIYS